MQFGCVLKVGVIGLNHKVADLPLREAVAKSAAALQGQRALFFQYPTVLLSTCNRTEIYFSAEELGDAHSELVALLRERVKEPFFEHRLYSYFGLDCLAHLGKVAAGLDSAIFAESEIQRQVKVAYARAAESMKLPGALHFLFQKSLKISKSAREHLTGRGDPTLLQAVYHLAQETLDVVKAKILFVGYSETNRAIARFFVQKGVLSFSLVSRRPDKVVLERCAPKGREELSNWPAYDLVISATDAKNYLIDRAPQNRTRVIFDLSVPRNVDPAVQSQKTILYNIETANRWIEERRLEQGGALAACNALIWEGAVRAARSYRERMCHFSPKISLYRDCQILN